MNMKRRTLLTGTGSLAAWNLLPRIASAAGARDPRLLVVILRGALDGLVTVIPRGDPGWKRLRDDARLSPDGSATEASPLNELFALHPAMPNLHRLYREKQALFVHAVATPYRARSHFDGQRVLETGLAGVDRNSDGWLNRMVAALPGEGSVRAPSGLAVANVAPLILQGPAPVTTWFPAKVDAVEPDTVERLLSLYDRADPALHAAFARSISARRITSEPTMTTEGDGPAGPGPAKSWRRIAQGAARLMAADDGPRVATISFDGWDTHRNEGVAKGKMANLLGALDLALESFRTGIGPIWADTQVLVVTEFGRTVYENGTDGTDHGTGTAAMLLGGRVAGGRVVADWPGLADAALLENRDLAATTDLRAVFKGVLRDGFGLERSDLDMVFPDSGAIQPIAGLIR